MFKRQGLGSLTNFIKNSYPIHECLRRFLGTRMIPEKLCCLFWAPTWISSLPPADGPKVCDAERRTRVPPHPWTGTCTFSTSSVIKNWGIRFSECRAKSWSAALIEIVHESIRPSEGNMLVRNLKRPFLQGDKMAPFEVRWRKSLQIDVTYKRSQISRSEIDVWYESTSTTDKKRFFFLETFTIKLAARLQRFVNGIAHQLSRHNTMTTTTAKFYTARIRALKM